MAAQHPVLAGRRVIELGTMLAAPFAGHLLAQLGAEVIKVEPPAGDPTRTTTRGGAGGSFLAYNRGKQSVCIDLKTSEGQAVLMRLIASADVVLHNLSPASTRALGVTRADCLRVNPGVVYCHIQGYGSGPLENELASNPVIEASTGVMFGHRINGRPTRLGPSYHDQFAGSYAVIGILAALQAPVDDVDARCVELGLYETGLHVAARDYAGDQLKAQLGVVARAGADPGEFSAPGYGAYETADGRWVYLLMLSDGHWKKFCDALVSAETHDETLTTSRSRKKRRPEVELIVKTAVAALPLAELSSRLRDAGVGFTEIKPSDQVLNEAQAQVPGKLARLGYAQHQFELPNLPLPHQRAPLEGELPPPLLGEHTMAVLASIGYQEPECAVLQAAGVVAVLTQVGTGWAPPRA